MIRLDRAWERSPESISEPGGSNNPSGLSHSRFRATGLRWLDQHDPAAIVAGTACLHDCPHVGRPSCGPQSRFGREFRRDDPIAIGPFVDGHYGRRLEGDSDLCPPGEAGRRPILPVENDVIAAAQLLEESLRHGRLGSRCGSCAVDECVFAAWLRPFHSRRLSSVTPRSRTSKAVGFFTLPPR